MKRIRTARLIVLLSAAGVAVPALAQAPTTGAYVTDLANTYVQDQVLDSIGSVNTVMCFMSSLRAEQKVNQGAYVALVDGNKCDNKGSAGETTAAGADAAVDYVKAIVNSTRSGTDPMEIKTWMKSNEENNGTPYVMNIYASGSVSEGASTSNPNGVFEMRFSGYLDGANTKSWHGKLNSLGSTLTLYDEGYGVWPYSTALSLTMSGTTSGSGNVRTIENNTTVDATFAFNSTHFLRQKTGGSKQCFSRSKTDADFSVWRYGVYKADGSRHDVTNPGFQITYATGGNTYYGYAGYYGVYLPADAMTAIANANNTATVTRTDNNTSYSMTITGGRLTKMTKRDTTLDNIKGMPLRVWISGASGETKIYWDGTAFQKTETISCGGNGCASTAASGELTANSLRQASMFALHGHSESLGGSFSILVPAAGSFSGSATVTYRTREMVPAATAANLTLVCISECPNTSSNISGGSPLLSVNGNNYNYGPVPITSAKTYVFDASGMMFLVSAASGNEIDASALTLSGNYQYGVRSGTLAVASNAIKCNNLGVLDASGTNYCPHLIGNQTETYMWETGKQPWNWNIALTDANNQAVSFDAPKKLMVTLSTDNSSLPSSSPKIGAKLFLDFNGFGQLYGIPGSCYDPVTNAKGPCDGTTHTAYAPDFSLKAGATVTDDTNTTYYIKPLDQEIRFGRKSLSDCGTALDADLAAAAAATLPSSNGEDPRTTIGAAAPTPAIDKPAVIHGVVQ